MVGEMRTYNVDIEIACRWPDDEAQVMMCTIFRHVVNLIEQHDFAGNDDTPCESPSNNMLQELGMCQHEGRVVVDSRDVARIFDKEHRNVLRSIAGLKAAGMSDEFARLNFEPGTYKDANNQDRRMYWMTRDGFCMLAMGFTGPRAMRFKETYIRAFNVMEQLLSRSGSNLVAR